MNITRLLTRIPATRGARRAMLASALVVAVGLGWLAWSAQQARARLGASVATLRQQALLMERDGAEVIRLRQVKGPGGTVADAAVEVRSLAQSAGIAGALVRVDVLDANRVQVIFGTVAFVDWLAWVAALEGRRFWLESCRVEAAPAGGMVSVTAILVRAGR